LVELYVGAVGELGAIRGGRVLVGLDGREGSLSSSFATQLTDPAQLVVVGVLGAPGPPGPPGPPGSLERARAGSGAGYVAELAGETRVILGEIVGYGTCRLLKLSDGERLGSVQDLYVVPLARRNGVGRAMADQMANWCALEGCIGIDASALPGSRAVKSFFEAEGYKARVLVMHRPLN
jgi:GNAT superfamily N-acetyltransferase